MHKGVKRKREEGKSREELTQLKHKYAKFANTSYERLASSRISLVNDDAWQYDTHVSDKHQAVFVNPETKEVVTSFRGTKELDDLSTDLAIAIGAEQVSKRFRKQARDYQKVLDKYGEGYTHNLSSHSLGGTLNNYIQHKFKGRVSNVYNFNPGSSAAHAHKGIRSRLKGEFHSNIHNFLIAGDPISTLTVASAGSTNVLIDPQKEGASNPHSLENFL